MKKSEQIKALQAECDRLAAERDALAARVRVLEGQIASEKRAAGSREGWERAAALEAENAALRAALDDSSQGGLAGSYLEFNEQF